MASIPRGRTVATMCLILLGTLAATVAILLPSVVVPHAKKLPASISQQVRLSATDATVLDNQALAMGSVRSDSHVPLRVDVNVKSAQPTDEDIVTLVAAVRTTRTDREGIDSVVSGYVDRVSLSRATAVPQQEPVPLTIHENRGQATESPRTGYQYNFPIGVGRHDYPVYDSEARLTTSATYLDDDRVVEGVELYHFQQRIEDVNLHASLGDVASLEMPSSAWGMRQGDTPVRMALYYSVIRDLWIDPTTGMIVDQHQNILRQLGNDEGLRVTSLQADFRFSDATVTDNAKTARQNGRLLFWGSTGVPIALGLIAITLLGAGILVGWSRHNRMEGQRRVAHLMRRWLSINEMNSRR